MKLLIIRHGDPDYSIDSLTPTGWQEAELLSHRLTGLDVKALYVSPLGRARDTAKPTLEKLGRTAEVLPWLREFSPRIDKPGDTCSDCCWDWLPADWTAEPKNFAQDLWARQKIFEDAHVAREAQWVWDGLDELLLRHGYRREGRLYRAEQPNTDTVVLFCHFGLGCLLLSHLLHISPMLLWHGACAAPTSVTTLATEERQKGIACFRMLSFGDTAHLYAEGREPSVAARFCEIYDDFSQRHN